MPAHTDFKLLVKQQYWGCLEDHINYLYKKAKFDELQAAVFVVTKVFEYQSLDVNSHQKLRALGSMGELMSDASVQLFYTVAAIAEEDPARYKIAFNVPDPSIFEDLERARTIGKRCGSRYLPYQTPEDANSLSLTEKVPIQDREYGVFTLDSSRPVTWPNVWRSVDYDSEMNKGSKLEDALEYFFEFSIFALNEIKIEERQDVFQIPGKFNAETNSNITEEGKIYRGNPVSEADKYAFRQKHLSSTGLADYGVMFFSRIEIEALAFSRYHYNKRNTLHNIDHSYPDPEGEFREWAGKTILDISDIWRTRRDDYEREAIKNAFGRWVFEGKKIPRHRSHPLIAEVRSHLQYILKNY